MWDTIPRPADVEHIVPDACAEECVIYPVFPLFEPHSIQASFCCKSWFRIASLTVLFQVWHDILNKIPHAIFPFLWSVQCGVLFWYYEHFRIPQIIHVWRWWIIHVKTDGIHPHVKGWKKIHSPVICLPFRFHWWTEGYVQSDWRSISAKEYANKRFLWPLDFFVSLPWSGFSFAMSFSFCA